MKKIIAGISMMICLGLIILYDVNLYHTKDKVTTFQVDKSVIEKYYEESGQREAPLKADVVIQVSGKEKSETIEKDVYVWNAKQDAYMNSHKQQFIDSFSYFDTQVDDVEVFQEMDYTIFKGSRILASLGKNGDYSISAIGKSAEYNENAKLPEVEKASKDCEKVLKYFGFSYRADERFFAKGVYVCEPDCWKQENLFYEKTVDGIPIFDNGYLFEYQANGIVNFSAKLGDYVNMFVVEDDVERVIKSQNIISCKDAKKRVKSTLENTKQDKRYKEYNISEGEFYYIYDEVSKTLEPGWVFPCEVNEYNFETEQWASEEKYFFCDAEGETCSSLGERKWLAKDFIRE
ncbi:MAG: hypothetical protein II992_07750 [Lachnospiraceae bacterium]|nr:hypothetical protein [Lachnospiraceae bacterium]